MCVCLIPCVCGCARARKERRIGGEIREGQESLGAAGARKVRSGEMGGDERERADVSEPGGTS